MENLLGSDLVRNSVFLPGKIKFTR